MRAFSMEGDDLQLGLADVEHQLQPAVEDLGFTRVGALFVKRFPADAQFWDKASARFEFTVEEMVLQAAGLAPVRLDRTLELLRERAVGFDWRPEPQPRHLEVIGDVQQLAAALADMLVEPLADGRFRAFGQARIDCRVA